MIHHKYFRSTYWSFCEIFIRTRLHICASVDFQYHMKSYKESNNNKSNNRTVLVRSKKFPLFYSRFCSFARVKALKVENHQLHLIETLSMILSQKLLIVSQNGKYVTWEILVMKKTVIILHGRVHLKQNLER